MKRGINIPKAVVAGSLVSPFRASEEPVFGTYVLTMPQVCPHQNRILRKDLMMKHLSERRKKFLVKASVSMSLK